MRKVLLIALVALIGSAARWYLRHQKLKMGVTIEDFNDVFMRYALDQLTDEAKKNNIDVIAADGKRDPNEQIKQIENFITQGVDAILIHVIDQTIAPRITKLCLDAKIPLVYFNRKPDDVGAVRRQGRRRRLSRSGGGQPRGRVRRQEARRQGQRRHPDGLHGNRAPDRPDPGNQGRHRQVPGHEGRPRADRQLRAARRGDGGGELAGQRREDRRHRRQQRRDGHRRRPRAGREEDEEQGRWSPAWTRPRTP